MFFRSDSKLSTSMILFISLFCFSQDKFPTSISLICGIAFGLSISTIITLPLAFLLNLVISGVPEYIVLTTPLESLCLNKLCHSPNAR